MQKCEWMAARIRVADLMMWTYLYKAHCTNTNNLVNYLWQIITYFCNALDNTKAFSSKTSLYFLTWLISWIWNIEHIYIIQYNDAALRFIKILRKSFPCLSVIFISLICRYFVLTAEDVDWDLPKYTKHKNDLLLHISLMAFLWTLYDIYST